MFFATSRLGSRKHPTESYHNPIAEVTDELTHPSRVLFTEEVILGICMVITGLLYAFAQVPGAVVNTAAASRSFVKHSVASFSPAARTEQEQQGMPLIEAAQPMFTALRRAHALESSGDFGPATVAAWNDVLAKIQDLTHQQIATSDRPMPLWILRAEQERAAILESRLQDMLGKAKQAMLQLRREMLTPKEVTILDLPVVDRSVEQAKLAEAIEGQLDIPWSTVAAVLPESQQAEAKSLCQLLDDARANAETIKRLRDVLNFDTWMSTATVASTPEGLRAREATARASRTLEAGDLEAAQSAYEKSLTAWQAAFIAHPEFTRDEQIVRIVDEQIIAYRQVLAELGSVFDESFSLRSLLGNNI
jgi:hypothetical protein